MNKDYGVRRRRRLTRGQVVTMASAGLIFLALAGWLYGGAYLRDRQSALSLNAGATVDGPPCPELTAAQFKARGLKLKYGTIYQDATFYRQFGHMSCRSLRYGGGWSTAVYPVCQFTGPGALRVTTPKGDWYYAPGFAQPATIATPHGKARCLLASNFTMKRLLRRGP